MTIDRVFIAEMLTVTADMLMAAQSNEWDVLVDLENRRVQMIELANAKSRPGAVLMDEESIRKVQASDDETRRLVQVRMTEIGDIFNASPLGRRLSRAYSDMADQA